MQNDNTNHRVDDAVAILDTAVRSSRTGSDGADSLPPENAVDAKEGRPTSSATIIRGRLGKPFDSGDDPSNTTKRPAAHTLRDDDDANPSKKRTSRPAEGLLVTRTIDRQQERQIVVECEETPAREEGAAIVDGGDHHKNEQEVEKSKVDGEYHSKNAAAGKTDQQTTQDPATNESMRSGGVPAATTSKTIIGTEHQFNIGGESDGKKDAADSSTPATTTAAAPDDSDKAAVVVPATRTVMALLQPTIQTMSDTSSSQSPRSPPPQQQHHHHQRQQQSILPYPPMLYPAHHHGMYPAYAVLTTGSPAQVHQMMQQPQQHHSPVAGTHTTAAAYPQYFSPSYYPPPMMMMHHHPGPAAPYGMVPPMMASPGIPLSLPNDAERLSEYQTILRQQFEFFQAGPLDAQTTAQGRKRPVVIGQVGIRCRHCLYMPLRSRGRGSVYFPSSLMGIYQAGQNMAGSHLTTSCPRIPEHVTQELLSLRSRRDNACGGKHYWADGARALGVYEEPGGGGLRWSPEASVGLVPTNAATAPVAAAVAPLQPLVEHHHLMRNDPRGPLPPTNNVEESSRSV